MKEIIEQIIKVSNDLRHEISMGTYKNRIDEGQKQLLSLIEVLRIINK